MLNEKRCICFVDLERTFDRVRRKVLKWAMRKIGMAKVLVGSMMSQCEGAKIRVRAHSEL